MVATAATEYPCACAGSTTVAPRPHTPPLRAISLQVVRRRVGATAAASRSACPYSPMPAAAPSWPGPWTATRAAPATPDYERAYCSQVQHLRQLVELRLRLRHMQAELRFATVLAAAAAIQSQLAALAA